MTKIAKLYSSNDGIYDEAPNDDAVDYEYLRPLKEESDAYDDFIASMDMDKD